MPAATEQKTPAEAGEGDHYAQRGARDLRIARTEISREAARCYDSEVYGFQFVNRSPDSVQIAATVHRGVSKETNLPIYMMIDKTVSVGWF
jgi:hypothetical protein